ncbi:phage portal protein [Pseudoroseomonas ludipueritiae]|uniref:Phage portal protein n=1 Tax=Pseudoroseomonas ludipueritiae TaxID=198093 RepID=A0ABR7R9W7_9PROT|nr:phage portal protein [Pseudoroseomonas ludipueritiae]MBC9178561.1 phage portal protein [Pseudoroseomonas ludipueritiae]MCG7363201.1 phage portal protein [Roseomonas sp. ACRSG]
MKLFWPFGRRQEQRRSREWDTWRNPPSFAFARTASGINLTRDSPLSHETVLACYNIIAEDVAMLPAYLYRERGQNRRQATEHPLYELLLTSPAPHMTAFRFWYTVIFEKLHYGNHYSLIDRDSDGQVRELLPLADGTCDPFWYRDPADGRRKRAYRISLPDGPSAVALEHEVFHVSGMPILRGTDYTLKGASIWQLYAQEVLGGALATNEFAHKSFANGASLSGFISFDGAMDPEALKAVKERVRAEYTGAANAGMLGVFGGGAEFHPISQDAQKAQVLDTRKFNRSTIGGLLRVTSHLFNDLERGTFSNIEHLDLGHYKRCIRPHLVDLCQVIQKDLLTPAEGRAGYYVDHDESELLRGDAKTRAEVLEKAIQNARLTPNEARAEENRPPKPGGDTLYINSASVPLELAAKGLAAKAGATPPAVEPPEKDTPDDP